MVLIVPTPTKKKSTVHVFTLLLNMWIPTVIPSYMYDKQTIKSLSFALVKAGGTVNKSNFGSIILFY